MIRRGLRSLALLAALAVVAACSPAPAVGPAGSGPPAFASPSSAQPPPTDAAAAASLPAPGPSAWAAVLGKIGPDGAIGVDTALQAFSLAFGPLPGVTVPAGPVGTIRSGSGPLRWLAGHWDDITDAQRAQAVRLVPELAATTATSRAPSATEAELVAYTGPVAAVRPAAYYAALARSMADEIEAQTQLHLDLPIFATEGRTEQTNALADTGVYNARGGRTGTAARCVITVSARGAAEPLADLEDTMGHEVWHCYQGQIRGLDWYWSPLERAWLVEGQAEWVGDELRPQAAAPAWDLYVSDPGKTLFSRSYDALGFYAHLTQANIDTWHVLVTMLQAADDNAARFEASGATSAAFLDTWASGFFRDPAAGPAWELEGPGLPEDAAATPLDLRVGNGATTPFRATAYANSIYNLSSSADVVAFDVTGHARLGDPGLGQEHVLAGGTFCTRAGGCTCPPGTAFAGAPPMPLSADTLLAVTGGQEGTKGTVTGHRVEELCHPDAAGRAWSMVLWSPSQGESAPPLLAAYTCDGLASTWKVIYLPSLSGLTRTFELPFGAGTIVHRDIHYDIPADKQSGAMTLDYALDFELLATADPPAIRVSGTKSESQGGQTFVFPPREFGSDAPIPLRNVTLEAQLKAHPEYQHPFRTQALSECGA